jgi:C4-dicarboxylate transporter DctM subunit
MAKVLDRLEEVIIGFLIAAATALIFIAVLHRYGTGLSIDLAKAASARGFAGLAELLRGVFSWLSARDLSWAQELCIYMVVWMAKFGAAYGVRTGIHVGVDVLVNLLDGFNRRRAIVFGLLAGAVFTGIVGWLGAHFVARIYETGQRSNDLEVPMWIVYLAVPLGSFLMCFRFLQAAAIFIRTGALAHHDPGAVAGLERAPSGQAQP